MKILAYLSENQDPYFNLAAEDYLYRRMDPEDQILLLYRNRETVVIGRFQNPWLECDVNRMEAEGVLLARRQSGGGTVFHDLGNTNYTFFSGAEEHDKVRNCDIVVRALESLGINAESSDRSDIMVDGKKISGSAFRMKKDRIFHHGTLLVNADLKRLSAFLHPPVREITAKGVTSVRSKVANLAEFKSGLDHEIICRAVISSFEECYGGKAGIKVLDKEELLADSTFTEYRDLLSGRDWLLGKTPVFSHRIPLERELSALLPGNPDALVLRIKNGEIIEIETEGGKDAEEGMRPSPVLSVLTGVFYHKKDVLSSVTGLRSELPPAWAEAVDGLEGLFREKL